MKSLGCRQEVLRWGEGAMDENAVMGAEATGVPDGLQFVSLGGESETGRSGRKAEEKRKRAGSVTAR